VLFPYPLFVCIVQSCTYLLHAHIVMYSPTPGIYNPVPASFMYSPISTSSVSVQCCFTSSFVFFCSSHFYFHLNIYYIHRSFTQLSFSHKFIHTYKIGLISQGGLLIEMAKPPREIIILYGNDPSLVKMAVLLVGG
jgi:hypothetical protein